MRVRGLRLHSAALIALTIGAQLFGLAGVVRAEQAWVRGEIRLNLRTGPGTQFRIVEGLTTGNGVEILERGKNWTQVLLPNGKKGWIPAGYLVPEPPPLVRLEQVERQFSRVQEEFEAASSEAKRLQETNATLAGRDGEQQAEIERLSLEVLELSAGARWPEWITGASILVVGMIVGALLHRNATRRPSSRIRI
jgi:SH3 domain protein